jgi:hypothetical protein
VFCFPHFESVTAGVNAPKGVDGQALAKLDRETEELARS